MRPPPSPFFPVSHPQILTHCPRRAAVAYAFARNAWIRHVGPFNTVGNLVIGYICEWSHTPFVQPIDRMLVMTQTDSIKDPITGHGPIKRSNIARAHSIVRSKGIGGFYKGWGSYLLLACKPALQYWVFNMVSRAAGGFSSSPLASASAPCRTCGLCVHPPLHSVLLLPTFPDDVSLPRCWLWPLRDVVPAQCKAIIMARAAPRPDGLLTAAEAFIIGALGRAIATIATFPAQRANVMAKSGRTSSKGGGLLATLYEVYRTDGFAQLYSGMQPEITRGVLSAALMMMVKEKISVATRAFVVGGRVA